jgi:hypothetical protein
MNEHILSLAREKGFEALSSTEKSFVLSEMTASEYESIHLSLATMKAMDQDVVPPPHLRAALLRHPQLQHPIPNTAVWKKPLTMTAAFAAGALFMALFQISTPTTPVETVIPRTIIQHDTIVVRDTIIQTRWRTKHILQTDTQHFEQPVATQIPTTFYDTIVPMGKNGSSIGDTPALLDFLGLPEGKK